jgi:gamma-glutamyltranspeptidase/glutathione hydrolase
MPPEPTAPFATRHATNGMVCAVDQLAAGSGVAILRRGGSAADAAVAASAVLAVTSQHMCGMGGDLFALVHHRQGPPDALNASGRAGSGADAARLRAEGHTEMPLRGDIRSVPVPGCVDGWLALHDRHGRLPLAEVLADAVAYADDGFPASPTLAHSIAVHLRDVDHADDYTAGGPVRPGDVIRRPGIARGLRAIVDHGRDGWYGGEFGDGLLELGGGEHTADDLATPLADWVDPLGQRAFDHDLWTIPPNSQGYLTLAGAWIADGLPLPDDPDDPLWGHLLVEAARQAGHDRPEVLHDGADGAALVAPVRLAPRRDAVSPDAAAALGGSYRDGGTVALVAADRTMAVSLIQSNAAGWGAHLVVPGVRVFLQNRGIGFNLTPGHPAEYGPGRRPPHTLAPALVTRPDGSRKLAIGTMGGDSQPQVLLQLLTRLLRNGESPSRAVAAGRFALAHDTGPFHTWSAGGDVTVEVEGHAPDAWDDGLRVRGHRVQRRGPWDHGFGHAHVIADEGDRLAGATDPRPRTGGAATW